VGFVKSTCGFVVSMGVCRFYVGLLILWSFVDSVSGLLDSMSEFVGSMRVGRFCEWVFRFCGVYKFYERVCRFYGDL
jgi:hypothetical protein